MSKKKIKILFDAGPLVNGNKTGIGRTTEGLILALAHEYPELELVGHYFDFLGSKQNPELPHAPNIRYRRTVLIPGRIVNMLRRLKIWIPFELLVKERGDFHLFPAFIGWPSLFKTPSAPFLHDITFIDYPEYVNGPARFDLKTIMPGTVRRSSFIITNSESSKVGLSRVYDLSNIPVLVEHIPPVNVVSITAKDAAARVAKLGIKGPYLLFFGTIEPRKNLVGLLRAYELLDASVRDTYSLVLGGGKGWHDTEIIDALQSLQKSGANVYQTGYVSDEDRAALFMQAAVYILPSHYEGFGMQLLEAMFYHSPMLLSDIPVLHEVAKDSAFYCGTSPEAIAENITRLLSDDKLLNSKASIGVRRLQDFSWKIVAQEIYGQIEESIR